MSTVAKPIAIVAAEKATKIVKRIRLWAELFAIAAVLLTGYAAHKGWVIAQFIPPAIAIGGPAELEVTAANQETSQAARPVHQKAIKSADAGPTPGRKPPQ